MAYYQQKKNPTKSAPNREKKASIYGAMLSVAVPLIMVVSAAIALVRTETPLVGRSNQPMFFLSIPSYKSFLMPYVTFSPIVEKLILLMQTARPVVVAIHAK